MSNGIKPTTRFKNVVPVMIYLSPDDRDKLTLYAKKNKLAASQVAREGLKMRIDGSDYNTGFNDGLNEAMKITRANQGAQMKFPSGKSFADLVCDDIEQFIRGKP